MGEELNQSKPKIAVIAVHGVADQLPHDSARAIASLLLNHNQSEKQVQYTPFYESTLRLAVRPVRVAEDPPTLESVNEPGDYIHNAPQTGKSELSNERSPTDVEALLEQNSHRYMWEQLNQYKGEGVKSTYETVRLEGTRLQGNEPQANVHIYEMYWADLSRLGTGIIRILGEFYQLLFHLSSLGVHAVDSASIEYQTIWWNWYSKVQAGASLMLSVFIPILNLYLLLTTPITLPGNIPTQYLPTLAWSVLSIIIAALIGYFVFWRKPNKPFYLWGLPPALLVGGVLLVVKSFLLKGRFNLWLPLGYSQTLAFEVCALSALLMWLLMKEYGRHRPYAGKVSTVIGVFLGGILTNLLLSAPDSHQGITDAAFKTIEAIYWGLGASWVVFFVLQFLAALLGCISVYLSTTKQPNREQWNNGCRERAKQAAWTARLTLAVPASLFITVTLMLLGALDRVGSRLLPKENFYTPQIVGAFLPDPSKIPFSGPDFIHQLIIAAASPAFGVIVLGMFLTVLIAAWSLVPVAWAEVCPPNSDNESSERFGEWLTKGFRLMNLWGNVFVVTMAILFPIAYVFCILNPQIEANFALTEEILGIFATVLVASATSLLAFRGRLDRLLRGVRSVLDIVLDVDNYLRLHPLDDNPRARICARYVSVLRYLCKWEDPQDQRGYDAILIVAHSQGTVITADLLRFLQRETKAEADPALQKLVSGNLPIYFFTMGCPLRQLYGLSFPHLYNWARHYDPKPWHPGDPQYIVSTQKPDPTKLLGLTRWVNTFRSGDYIGRYLWRGDMCNYQWLSPAKQHDNDTAWTSDRDLAAYVSEDNTHTRGEFCLGAGAHTHYWDGTSDAVAAEIDFLIREACTARDSKKLITRPPA